jgi:hypothetical protein
MMNEASMTEKMNVTTSNGRRPLQASDGRYHSSRGKYRKGDLRKTNLEEVGTTSFGTDGYYDGSPGRKRRKSWKRTDKWSSLEG